MTKRRLIENRIRFSRPQDERQRCQGEQWRLELFRKALDELLDKSRENRGRRGLIFFIRATGAGLRFKRGIDFYVITISTSRHLTYCFKIDGPGPGRVEKIETPYGPRYKIYIDLSEDIRFLEERILHVIGNGGLSL